MSLENKVAIITGASRGIGLATCQRFLKENIKTLIMISSNATNLLNAINQLDNKHNIYSYQCDLSSQKNIEKTFDSILSKFTKIDILINNAGIIDDSPTINMTEFQMHHVMDINFYAPFYCIQRVLPIMINNNYGKIVNISSTSKFGTINKANYASSKSALDALTRTVAKEVASNNITVNSVVPELIDTDMVKSIPSNILSNIVNTSPMKRMGTPEEIASIIYFLSSDDSSYVTGESIIASGGLMTI